MEQPTFLCCHCLSVNLFKMDCEPQELRYDWELEISGTESRSKVEF